MNSILKISSTTNKNNSLVVLTTNKTDNYPKELSTDELTYLKKQIKLKNNLIAFPKANCTLFVAIEPTHKAKHTQVELCRKLGYQLFQKLSALKIKTIDITNETNNNSSFLALLEGLLLSDYSFSKYFTSKENIFNLETINVISKTINKKILEDLVILTEGTKIARDLVNEPQSFLNTQQFSKEIKKCGKKAGFDVEVFSKTKIESLKMGGLLAVNKGSIDPPAFNILTYKPANAVNKKPIVFVGKGVVYDTGGLSLKPTTNAMDHMKCDMGGGAAVTGALYAIAKARLPIHIIGLIPATDNRPSGNAYAPGDVITMYDGTTVEVLNTDAEGRLILADALSYSLKFKPEVVIDLATLTGAAFAAVGQFAIASMTNHQAKHDKLVTAGNNTYERLAQMPMWEEYSELIKSPIADIKNLGGSFAGAITAGKFLEHFIKDQDWVHLDIAGPAFSDTEDSYRSKGASGVGVRLLFDYAKQLCNE